MADLDLLGDPLPAPNVTPSGHPRRVARGYAATPGTGPDGKTCGDCTHLQRTRPGGRATYFKCGLLKPYWTCGPGTDIRKRSPACVFFEATHGATDE